MVKNILSLVQKIEDAIPLYHITFFVLIGLIVYFRVFFNGFVWDDQDQIVNNPLIQHISNFFYFFTGSTFATGGAVQALAGAFYRPFLSIVFTFIFSVWGLNPFGFHLFDVTLHIVNTILMFFLIKRVLNLEKLQYSQTAAFVVVSLYLVHPANVESVAYISATSELMYVFFLLVGLLTALSFCLKKYTSFIQLSIIFFAILASLFSKESGILSIVLILVLSWLYFRNKFVLLLIACASSLGVYSFFRFSIATLSSNQQLSPIPIAHASLMERLLTVPYELLSYLRLIFFPMSLHISQVDLITNASDYRFSISLVIVFVSFIILGFLLIKSKLNTKLILFFLLWLLASISIVLNIIPLDFTIAERWIYLPLIGFLGIVALFIVKIFNSSNSVHKTIAFSILSLFFISFSARTIYRTFDWQNPLTLFSHDVVLSNNSAELLNNYGVALYTAGDHNKAREEFSRALQLAPDNLWTLNNLGSIYAQEGNYKKAKSLYEKSIQKSPTSTAYENLAQIYSLTEKPSETLNFVKQALITFPNSAKLNQLAALSSQAINATDEARIYAQKSLILDSSPDNVNALQQIIK